MHFLACLGLACYFKGINGNGGCFWLSEKTGGCFVLLLCIVGLCGIIGRLCEYGLNGSGIKVICQYLQLR